MKIDMQLNFDGGYLKPLIPEDAHDGYVQGLNDPEVNRYLDTVKQSVQTQKSVTDFIKYNIDSEDSVLFGLWQPKALHHCGTVRLHAIEHYHKTANIGVCIFDQAAWGKGIGTKAVRTVSEWALGHFNLRWIEAGAYEQNIASQRTFESAGYTWVYDIPEKYLLEGKSAVVKVYSLKPDAI